MICSSVMSDFVPTLYVVSDLKSNQRVTCDRNTIVSVMTFLEQFILCVKHRQRQSATQPCILHPDKNWTPK